jgi:hypothetical protein
VSSNSDEGSAVTRTGSNESRYVLAIPSPLHLRRWTTGACDVGCPHTRVEDRGRRRKDPPIGLLDAGGDPALVTGWIRETAAIKKAAHVRPQPAMPQFVRLPPSLRAERGAVYSSLLCGRPAGQPQHD